jgi:hypothetical protein
MRDLVRPTLRGLRWFAAEFFVVVAGILVALAVQSWWNDRSARLAEHALLQRLRAEFVSNRRMYDDAVEAQRSVITTARRVLEWTGPHPSSVDEAEFESLVAALCAELPRYRPAVSELQSMLASGQLALIRNDGLRAKLAAWPLAVELVGTSEKYLADMVIREFYPYLLERIPLLNLDVSYSTDPAMRRSGFDIDYRILLRDVQFENHVENRWTLSVYILSSMANAHALMEEIIALLDSELDGSASG